MAIRVGITRSLLFFHYYPLWRSFFRGLGAEIVLSAPTTRKILERGIHLGVSDLCLPMKLHLGHVEALRGEIDFLFVPRLVSLFPDTYFCPKFLGLPDVVRASIEGLPPLLSPCFNAKIGDGGLDEGFMEVGRALGVKEKRVQAALHEALEIQSRFDALLKGGWLPLAAMEALEKRETVEDGAGTLLDEDHPCIAIIGHPYNLYDEYLNFDLLNQVRQKGYQLLMPERVSGEEVEGRNALLRKKVYWSLSRRIVGAALSFLCSEQIEGMIFLSSFGCGPDSFSKDLVDRRVKTTDPVPYLSLVLDEHTSSAGLQTRLEAFLDMVRWRRRKVHGKRSAS